MLWKPKVWRDKEADFQVRMEEEGSKIQVNVFIYSVYVGLLTIEHTHKHAHSLW